MPTRGSGFTARGVNANRRMTIAWSTSSRPTEATTLASTGASRSGRKISQWISSPRTTLNTNDSASAGQNGIGPPSEIVLGTSGRSRVSFGLEPVAEAFDERQRIGQRRHEEIALGAQSGVEIGDVHGDRAVGEVDDA